MTYFLKSGTSYKIATKESMDLHEQLPAGNYIVQVDPFGNMFLAQVDPFEKPKKLYGDALSNTDRIIRTFTERSVSTGVMLTGEKGSGKTLLSKNIAMELAKDGIPTIIINAPYHGDVFNKLLQDIDQPCMILFDEFEKVYDKDQQEEILTLLDGVFGSKKLYMLTCNDKWRVDSHMRNRPGRIYYMIDFVGLAPDFIAEYCEDNLINKKHIDTICSIAGLFSEFNFDMLKALVEEMNRYNETPQDALRLLNAKPEYSDACKYDVSVIYGGESIKSDDIHPNIFKGNPINKEGVEVTIERPKPGTTTGEEEYIELEFGTKSLVTVNAREGKFVFEDKGTKLILTKVKEEAFTYSSYAF